MVPSYFVISADIPSYVLTSEDLKLGTSEQTENEKFVFLGLVYITHSDPT